MNYNTRIFSLDSIQSWSWNELSNLKIILDYVSVGEFDDSELQIDAAGLIVKHLQPWGTFEALPKHLILWLLMNSPFFRPIYSLAQSRN